MKKHKWLKEYHNARLQAAIYLTLATFSNNKDKVRPTNKTVAESLAYAFEEVEHHLNCHIEYTKYNWEKDTYETTASPEEAVSFTVFANFAKEGFREPNFWPVVCVKFADVLDNRN